jgi:YD repeat-containing protein
LKYYDEDAHELGGPNAVLAIREVDETSASPDRITTIESNSLLGLETHITQLVDDSEEVIENHTYLEYENSQFPRLVTRKTSPNGSVTEFAYNELGDLESLTDDHGNTWRFRYTQDLDEEPFNPMHDGLIRRIEGPDITTGPSLGGHWVEFQYDEVGNLIKVIDDHFFETHLGRRADGLVESVTDARGFTTTFTYRTSDKRLETITTPGGPYAAPSRTYTLDYDDFGNVISVKDPLDNEVTYVFDAADRVVEMTDARGKTIALSFVDGLLESIVAPPNAGSGSNTRSTRFSYDDAGRLILVEAEMAEDTFQKRVGYAYTGFSQLKELSRLKDSLDKFTRYSYDRLGRPVGRNMSRGLRQFVLGFSVELFGVCWPAVKSRSSS